MNILKKYQDKIIMTVFICISVFFIIPSIIYMLNNGTLVGFENYYSFFIDDNTNKVLSSTIYVILFGLLMLIYLYFIKKKDFFKNIKDVVKYSAIIGFIFIFVIPWNSSDIFYYMGVGELDAVYRQNPYYVTIKEYCKENPDILKDDTIMQQANINYWAKTTVVYGPFAQFIFKIITKLSFKNFHLCLFLFKLLNLLVHILNCFLIYKITKKKKFSIIYGLNPYIFLEFIGMVHMDIIIVFFMILSIYFLINKKKILPSIVCLAIATGIKYFSILLLPVIVLYYFRNEKSIFKRIIKCIEYGIIFCVFFLLQYLLYFKNINIFLAMMVQTDRFSKSIYSGLYALLIKNNIKEVQLFGLKIIRSDFIYGLRNIMLGTFIVLYLKFCIDLLFSKKIKISTALRKYNFRLVLFIISLSNFQQWYLVWMFVTLPWQKSNTIKNIIGISAISQIANSIYMFKEESYKWDLTFNIILIIGFLIWVICTNKSFVKKIQKQLKKGEDKI